MRVGSRASAHMRAHIHAYVRACMYMCVCVCVCVCMCICVHVYMVVSMCVDCVYVHSKKWEICGYPCLVKIETYTRISIKKINNDNEGQKIIPKYLTNKTKVGTCLMLPQQSCLICLS